MWSLMDFQFCLFLVSLADLKFHFDHRRIVRSALSTGAPPEAKVKRKAPLSKEVSFPRAKCFNTILTCLKPLEFNLILALIFSETFTDWFVP